MHCQSSFAKMMGFTKRSTHPTRYAPSIPMEPFRKQQPLVLWSLPVLLLLSGCGGPMPECDSLDARNSVVKIVSGDSNNALVNYALKNSSAVAAMVSNASTEAEKLAIGERARQGAGYRLDDTIRMNSRSRATRTVACSGLLYVTVGDTTAQKQVDFKVEQTADGKMLVSVSPFLFWASVDFDFARMRFFGLRSERGERQTTKLNWFAGRRANRFAGRMLDAVIPGHRAATSPEIHNHHREYGFRACAKWRTREWQWYIEARRMGGA
jgi:hypothetical protein